MSPVNYAQKVSPKAEKAATEKTAEKKPKAKTTKAADKK